MLKYKVGTKLIMTHLQTKEKLSCEVVAHNDQRVNKLAFPDDVCLYFFDFDMVNTYDEDFLDTCCERVDNG